MLREEYTPLDPDWDWEQATTAEGVFVRKRAAPLAERP
jgi:hypothetical protein